MKIYDWNTMTATGRDTLLSRSETAIHELEASIRPIVETVRAEGDQAVARFTKQFDGVSLKPSAFKVKKAEFDEAEKLVSPKVKAAILKAIANVRKYHEAQMPEPFWLTPVEPGVFAGEKITPIVSCALYVPRGKGSFPSVMVMLGVPATVAGVGRIAVSTPPGPDGKADAATLFAARECGITEVFKIGGAQGIAALAYGTNRIPKFDKIIGPGSSYVSAAKRLLFGVVDVGLPAGPSESIILADASADPQIVARDLLIEAEHGPDSVALLVTDSRQLAVSVDALLPSLVDALPEPRRSFCTRVFDHLGGAVITSTMAQAVEFTNTFAPEHLEVLTTDPFDTMLHIDNAGEILVGPHTPITLGNFCLGVDAILPTGAFARTFSGVTVYDFLKRTSIGYCNQQGFDSLAPTAHTLAAYEGFPAHAAAVKYRMHASSVKSK